MILTIPVLRSYDAAGITPDRAVRNGIRLLDRLTSVDNPSLPFGSNWRESLLMPSRRLSFKLGNPRRCLICTLCSTGDQEDSYTQALFILGITEGWPYGFDIPPAHNSRYARYEKRTRGGGIATLAYYDAMYAALDDAWLRHLRKSFAPPSGQRAFVPAYA